MTLFISFLNDTLGVSYICTESSNTPAIRNQNHISTHYIAAISYNKSTIRRKYRKYSTTYQKTNGQNKPKSKLKKEHKKKG